MLFRYMELLNECCHFTQTEKFSMLVAAVCHDLEHPGVTNAFLISTHDPLACVYNDSSVLENNHVCSLYTLLSQQPAVNIFRGMGMTAWKECRKIIIDAILHTDMTHHFSTVAKVRPLALCTSPAARAFGSPEDRQFLLSLLLHCADISNPVKPPLLSRRWSERVMAEFFKQGDLERSLGLPISPQMDRATTSVPMAQVNFIDFIVAPLYSQLVGIFPELQVTMDNLYENR
eukprot:jgi/Astpho2/3139/gw1.00051.251.1_t